jgi:integrase
MADKQKRRRRNYGTGCVIERGKGLAIRWREKVLQPDGTIKEVMRCKALGLVSKTDANKALQELIASSTVPKVAPIKFSELANRWKSTVLPVRKYSTRKHHRDILDNKLIPVFGDFRIDEINNEHVQQFIAELQRRNYASHSIHHYHNVLSTVLTKAVEWRFIPVNPAHRVELPRIVPKKEQSILTIEQAKALLDKLPAIPRCAVTLALATGLRRGELFAVRWQDFDEKAALLMIRRAVYDRVFDTPKTERSLRTIPLSEHVVAFLCDWRTKSKRTGPVDFIIPGRKESPRDQKRILVDHIKPACEALELPIATWLTFRRTFSTWADTRGVSAKIRAELMGHGPEINQSVYTKVIPEALRSAVANVGRELFANCSQSSNWVN